MNYTILLWLCWGAFGIVWIVGGIYNAFLGPRVERRGSGSWRLWLIALFLYWSVNRSNTHFLLTIFRFDIPWLAAIGAVLLIASTLFTLWSRVVLGKMWSSTVTVKTDHQLRTEGPYRITRNPIYTGILGMMLGSGLTGGLVFLPIFLIAVAVFFTKIKSEERLMMEKFGDQYIEYKKRVPRLIPGLRMKRRLS